jgi:hypothetical protein
MMRVEIYRCRCGLEVRAMVSEGCVAARIDRTEWLKQCLEQNTLRDPWSCRQLVAIVRPISAGN